MKKIYIIFAALATMGCTSTKETRTSTPKQQLQSVIEEEPGITGSILIFNASNNEYWSNDKALAKKGFIPASTFKIPNSIIALENGLIQSDTSIIKWDGKKRRMKIWEQDLTLRDAFQYSCVPCYQEFARKTGVESMQSYVRKFQYGDMKIDTSSLDKFWLEGESTISPMQQIGFLKSLYDQVLPVSKHTYEVMKKVMLVKQSDEYTLSGKTGWAMRDETNVGWYVGYIEKGQEVYFFATLLQPDSTFDLKKFPQVRKDITIKAFKKLGVIAE